MTNEKSENEKNTRSKLLLLLLLLLLTFIILSLSAYAWFTSNKKVSVDDLDVDVRAVNGLEISADAISWGVKIDKDDLISNGWTGHANQLPDSLGHASTIGELTTSSLASISNASTLLMYNGTVTTVCLDDDGNVTGDTDCDDPQYYLTTSQASEERCYDSDGSGATNSSAVAKCSSDNKTIMAFDIFLKVDKATTLYLTENAGVVNTSTDDLGIKNTTRVAFLVQGNLSSSEYRNGTDDGTEGSTAAQNLVGGEQLVIWEPNYDEHTAAGVAAAELYYGITGLTAGTGNSLQAYEGVKSVISDGVLLSETNSTKYPDYFASVTPDITTTSNNASQVSTTINLEAGVTKVRVYFWVEGQDVDTENEATGSNMKLSLEFTID